MFLDTHLMIENPEKYISVFANAGSDLITFHYEACRDNVQDVIKLIKSFDKKVGISIKPKTFDERKVLTQPEMLISLPSNFSGFAKISLTKVFIEAPP